MAKFKDRRSAARGEEKRRAALIGMQEWDMGLIGQHFDSLRTAVANKIEREWPARRYPNPGTKSLILGWYKNADNAWAITRFVMADSPRNPARKAEYALGVPPLIRTLADTLCSIVFLFGRPPERTNIYFRSGWRELVEDTERIRTAYGSEPAWADFIKERDRAITDMRVRVGITPGEAASPSDIPRWPIPSRMIQHSDPAIDRRDYLQYIYDWYYKRLSQHAHLAYVGIAATPLLLPGPESEESIRTLEIARTEHVMTSLTLMLAIVTELELQLKFGYADRAKYVWAVLASWDEDPKDFYRRFYEPILGTATAAKV